MLLVSVATGSHSALAGSFVTAGMAILRVAFFYGACDSAGASVRWMSRPTGPVPSRVCRRDIRDGRFTMPRRHPGRQQTSSPVALLGGTTVTFLSRSAAAPCSYGLPRARPFPVPFPSLVWPREGAVRYGDPPGALAGTAVGGADPANDHDDCVVVEFGQNPEGVRVCSDRCDRRGSFARHLATSPAMRSEAVARGFGGGRVRHSATILPKALLRSLARRFSASLCTPHEQGVRPF